jgi:hypothetical protein
VWQYEDVISVRSLGKQDLLGEHTGPPLHYREMCVCVCTLSNCQMWRREALSNCHMPRVSSKRSKLLKKTVGKGGETMDRRRDS